MSPERLALFGRTVAPFLNEPGVRDRASSGAETMAAIDILSNWRDVMADAVRADGPDLSMRQWAILLTIYMNSGPHTVRALARDLNVPKPAISRALDALSILGFIRRIRDPRDKRIVIVQRTADGGEYVDRFARLVEERMQEPTLGALYG